MPAREPAARRPFILVVSDDLSVLTFVSKTLSWAGYAVAIAHGAEIAFQVAEREEKIDLAVVDLLLEREDAVAFGERLCAAVPGLRVLFMSGAADTEIVRVDVAEHGLGFTERPVKADGLLPSIRRALDSPAAETMLAAY